MTGAEPSTSPFPSLRTPPTPELSFAVNQGSHNHGEKLRRRWFPSLRHFLTSFSLSFPHRTDKTLFRRLERDVVASSDLPGVSPRSRPPVADARELRRPTVVNEPLVRFVPFSSSSRSKPHTKRLPVAQDRASSARPQPCAVAHRRLRRACRRSPVHATLAARSPVDSPD
jgi:hypothetical protein